MLVQPASLVTPSPIEWLCPGYLAAGSLAIPDGDPGHGRSLLTLDPAARLTRGRAWPDGAAGTGPAAALLLCAEDVDTILAARLQSLGADLDRVFLWSRQLAAGWPRFPGDVERLDQALEESAAKLIVIDPI